MAWYEITGTCGHSFRKQLYGKVTGRMEYVEWAERNMECPDCYNERKENEKKLASEKAKEETKDMPELEGSIKQVQWAYVLRKERIDNLLIIMRKAIQNKNENYVEWLKNKIKKSKEETSAKFFIDLRNSNENSFKEAFEKNELKKLAEQNL